MAVELTDTSMGFSYPRTLLLVGSQPGRGNVGELLISEMLEAVQSDNLAFVGLIRNAATAKDTGSGKLPTLFLEHPPEGRSLHTRGRFLNLADAVSHAVSLKRSISVLANDIVEFAQRQQIQRLWVILNTPYVTALAAEVHRRLRVPLLTHVWDDIEHLTRQKRFDGWTRRAYQRKAGMLLARSVRTAVICEEMASHYSSNFGARCKIIRLGQQTTGLRTSKAIENQDFVIGYSGSMYSYSAWYAFLQALDELKWMLAGRPVRFVVLSGYVSFRANVPCHVEFMGWRNDEEVLQMLSGCDLLYLPQPFEKSEEPLTRLSFPTKMSSYSATGRPIFLHTPEYGSLAAFHRENSVGPISHSLEARELCSVLTKFSEDLDQVRRATEVVERVSTEVLSRAAFVRQVQEFLSE